MPPQLKGKNTKSLSTVLLDDQIIIFKRINYCVPSIWCQLLLEKDFGVKTKVAISYKGRKLKQIDSLDLEMIR